MPQIIDDRDPQLKYQGAWFHDSVYQAGSESGTISTTNDPNANVTMNFPVAAKGIQIWGIKRSHGGKYGICIDCELTAPVFIDIDGFNSTDDGHNPPVILYEKDFGTAGFHNLVLRNQADDRGTPVGNSQLALDQFVLVLAGDSTTAISLTPSGSSTTIPNSPSQTGNAEPSSNGKVNAALIGGIVGGVVALLILAILAFWLWRRRRRRKMSQQMDLLAVDDHEQHNSVEPYMVSRTSNDLSSFVTGPSSTFSHSKLSSGSHPVPPSSLGASSSSGKTRQTPRRHEVDAGPLSANSTLPPQYGDWAR
ncbi:hypothetical protein DL96DRAFT_1611569 [Flagelloscypha sp. PMI_526]|nr:hypothetical protein DL96DRAFT_1611569 [Flagelloscypha sp. PMI_526]